MLASVSVGSMALHVPCCGEGMNRWKEDIENRRGMYRGNQTTQRMLLLRLMASWAVCTVPWRKIGIEIKQVSQKPTAANSRFSVGGLVIRRVMLKGRQLLYAFLSSFVAWYLWCREESWFKDRPSPASAA